MSSFIVRFASAFLSVDSAQLAALERFESMVVEEAIPRGLVGVSPHQAGLEIARSLLLVPMLQGPGPIIDVGSGAGFPGIALSIVTGWPSYLVDSKRRSSTFLERVVRELNLDAVVVNEPAEVLGTGKVREIGTSVTARALAALPAALELTAPLCRVGGRILITAAPVESADPTKELLTELGLGKPRLKRLTGPLDLIQHVHIIDKPKATTSRYPRRPGRAQAKPG
jgi:16S rRNA (guanine527-N7)-methyltransferase